MIAHDTNLKDSLRHHFGLQEFRSGQEEAIQTLLTKKRLLCILPTGYGKSLLYQLPACLLPGMTVVISPLLALMRDQISHLSQRFNIPAAAINSDQSEEENSAARQGALNGSIKILFIAPEQLDHIDRFQFLLNLNVKLIVVDEAHCISTWGHDFRPSYRQILQFIHALHSKDPSIHILGLTATANKRVEEDIRKQLTITGGQEVEVVRHSMSRPNLQLSTIPVQGIASKLAACEQLLHQLNGCGLIYCATRENTELVADYLKHSGLNVTAYHAGFGTDEKRRLQTEFIADTYKALVATNALGMGIDKGNLRFIIHFDIPGSITAYYQEVGRCGRDGQEAKGLLIYDKADKRIQDHFIYSAVPTLEDFQKVIDVIDTTLPPPGLIAIKTLTGLHPTRVTIIIAELLEQGFIAKYSVDSKQVYRSLQKVGVPNLSRYRDQKEVKTRELEQMLHYGEQGQQCRMGTLQAALGDAHIENCRGCDICRKESPFSFSTQKIPQITAWIDARPLPIAANVREKLSEGLSVLDSKMRSPLFINFMKNRALEPLTDCGVEETLFQLLKCHLEKLSQKHKLAGLIPLPSRTWQGRIRISQALATHLGIPLLDILDWMELPPQRQGELLNNDQRHQNVHLRMTVKGIDRLPQGNIILFDDYTGSGNTLKEAARTLKSKRNGSQELIPFTIASLKWHLGKPGFA